MTTTFAEIAEYEDEHGKVVSGGVRTLDEMLQSSSDALREIGRQLKEVSDKKVVAKKMADKKVAAPTAPAPVEFPQRKPERTYAAFRARLEELERMEAQAEADAREPAKLSKKWNKGFLDKPRKPVAPPPAVLLDTPREPVAPPRAVTPTSQPAKKTVRFEDDDGLEKKDATSKEPRPKAPPLPSSRNKPAFAGFVGRHEERAGPMSLRSSAMKRGRYKGVWRSRFFCLPEESARLSYWESEAAMASGAKARGELEVYGATAVEDCERPYCVAIHVSICGAVGGVLRVAGVPSREEWIALSSASERDAWLGALRRAALLRPRLRAASRGFVKKDDETFEPDDSLWAEVQEEESRLASACVYDYSASRVGWRVVVSYHVQATGYGRVEPWVVRKTHADFREFLALAGDDLDAELDRKHGAMNPQRLLSATLLGRRVELINAALRRLVADAAISRSPELKSFLGPPPLARPRRVDPPATRTTDASSIEGMEDESSNAPPPPPRPRDDNKNLALVLAALPTARLAAALGAVAVAAAHRVYSVPPTLLAAVFAAGAVFGARLVASSTDGPPPDYKKRMDDDVVVVEPDEDKNEASPPENDEDEVPAVVDVEDVDYSLARWPAPLTAGGHCWSEPDASFFRVRGETYLDDRVKVPSGASLFPLAGVDLFLTDVPQQHVARHPGAFVAKRRRRRAAHDDAHSTLFAVNFCMPWGNLVVYWATEKQPRQRQRRRQRRRLKPRRSSDTSDDTSSSDDDSDDPPDSRRAHDDAARTVFERFAAGDDAYRDARLKLIPRVVEGNWIVRRAVGSGTNAAKLAEAVKLSYFSGPDYFEVDLDIVGSPLARRILSVVRSATSTLVLDLAFVIEGVKPEELPERILGAVRMHRVNPDDAPVLKPLE
ncbi:hypothetical protein CTAYLR_009266 [Chrysophaeum taylorii]|uniref:PH domain-containing protein n=1 Tax=Chrysophaeum taylorii TaxID=2483200 RepID=A0AAD7U720_9STRA|nr:hypothetical protein CTAYLR_009266 [Chrysophaeum taylorii]